MKKAKIVLSIICAVYSSFYFVISLLAYLKIENPFITFFNNNREYGSINFQTCLVFAATTVIAIINTFKTNMGISIALIVLSISNANIIGVCAGAFGLKLAIDLENERKRKENEEKGIIEESIISKDDSSNLDNQIEEEIIIKKEPEIIISDKYKPEFIAAIIINSLYLIAYFIYLITVVINNYDTIVHWISPWHVFEDLGPAALGFIIIYPFYLISFLFVAVFFLLPFAFLLFSLILNIEALKKDIHSYYALRVVGILTFVFINSYRSFKIVKDIEAQKRNWV